MGNVLQHDTDSQQRDPDGWIHVQGARTHNLKNISVRIPRDRLVVVTGPSGSGKSSLAFDTIYAEGKRQFIETLSPYARQFMEQVPRPDVDSIEGLQPTLCIDQRPGSLHPRSTVGTITEIHDYLRLMMARLGRVTCRECGNEIRPQSISEIVERLLRLPEGTRLLILAPIVRAVRGIGDEVISRIRRAGLVRLRVNGQIYELEHLPPFSAGHEYSIEAVVDRVVIRHGSEPRLRDSLRLAIDHGQGIVTCCYHDESDADVSPEADDDWREETLTTLNACPECGVQYVELEPRLFSFNSPHGACPDCEGLGIREQFDPDLVIPNHSLSVAKGAIAPWPRSADGDSGPSGLVQRFLAERRVALDLPISSMRAEDWQCFWYGEPHGFVGISQLLEKELATAKSRAELQRLSQFRSRQTCTSCAGTRLNNETRAVHVAGLGIHEFAMMSIAKSLDFFRSATWAPCERPVADPIVTGLLSRLEYLSQVGLDYLTLDRGVETLSGGEFQRVRLASSVGSGLVGVCYILDEPSIGLHARDNQRLISTLRRLQQFGNTVLAVEHDEELMRHADWILDLGPAAGPAGGCVQAAGPLDSILASESSITANFLTGRQTIETPKSRRSPSSSAILRLGGASTNNLKNINLEFPLGLFVCVTGVSGSGKSSLINHTLAPALRRRLDRRTPAPDAQHRVQVPKLLKRLVSVDQSPLGLSPRSNVATATGIFDEIRKVFALTPDARARGFRASRFSFNNRGGRCESCQGQGERKIEMGFLPAMYVTCQDCRGTRFNRQTLEIRFREKSIADVLAMPIGAARLFFENHPLLSRVLNCLDEVGLGYLSLGQPATTFSGGEAQRVKLANELSRTQSEHTLYLFDEPTTGLHFEDVRRFIGVIQRLIEQGHSVLVIEHNLDVVKSADWVIDLGPEGGDAGGYVVAEGTPEDVARNPNSITGQYLARLLALQGI
jgi:excinuclease ABC subunit A